MQAAIFEPDPSGHRLHFVALIAEGLIDLGLTPTWITSPQAAASDQAKVHISPLVDTITTCVVAKPIRHGTTGVSSRFVDLKRAAEQSYDWLYVPYADHIAQVAGLPGAWPSRPTVVEALLFRSRFAYPKRRLRDFVTARASLRAATHTPWSRLFLLDPLACDYLEDDARFPLMPEPVDQRVATPASEARSELGLPAVEAMITLVGSIDGRKGAQELTVGFLKAGISPSVHLAIIGGMAPGIRESLESIASGSPRVHIVERHLSDEDFWLALCAGDIIAAPYPRHIGSSGIVARAAYLGRPLLASEYGWVGEATRRYELGITVDATSVDSIAVGIERLVSCERRSTRSDRSEEYVRFNTSERFIALWTESIAAAV